MSIRYYLDPETKLSHIYDHDVMEKEVEWVLAHPLEDGPASKGSRQAIGKTIQGRFLRVIYVPDEDDDGIFVVTAYPVEGKQLKALPRRHGRRR